MKNILLITFSFLIACNTPAIKEEKKVSADTSFSAKEIYQRIVNNTVTILTDKILGSGFFIDSNKIITNYHVIKDAAKADVVLNNSDKKHSIIGYLAIDKLNDLVLLQVDYTNNDFIKMEDNIPQPGEKIFAIGSPVGLAKTISEGIVSGIRNFDDRKLLQITAPISHGSSGCPIINEQGKLVGVATGGISEANDVNFCIPITFVKTLIDFKENYVKNLEPVPHSLDKENKIRKKEINSNPTSEVNGKESNLDFHFIGGHFIVVDLGVNHLIGYITISYNNNNYFIKGEAGYVNYLMDINGEIKFVSNQEFIFIGTIMINKNKCDWKEELLFKYFIDEFGYPIYKMQESDFSCQGIAGNIEIRNTD